VEDNAEPPATKQEPKEEELLVETAVIYDSYDVIATNSSPCGYGIGWPNNPPADLRPGDVIGVCENESTGWCVGILHWVRQRDRQIDAGLEVFSRSAQPCAVCLVQRKNKPQSDYLRGLLLPEIKSFDRPVMLITPKSVFNTGNLVKVCLGGQSIMVTLTRQVLVTHSICLFEFALVEEGVSQVEHSDLSDIDALWEQL
jgi:hypothetical protein